MRVSVEEATEAEGEAREEAVAEPAGVEDLDLAAVARPLTEMISRLVSAFSMSLTSFSCRGRGQGQGWVDVW